MRTNFVKTASVAAAAISISLLSPLFAHADNDYNGDDDAPMSSILTLPGAPTTSSSPAVYPPIFGEVKYNSATIIIGKPKVTVTNVVTLVNATSSTSIRVNAALRVYINGVRSGATAKLTLKTPDNKKIELPSFSASRSGVVDVNALAIKITGTYTLTFELPSNVKKVLTITVTN